MGLLYLLDILRIHEQKKRERQNTDSGLGLSLIFVLIFMHQSMRSLVVAQAFRHGARSQRNKMPKRQKRNGKKYIITHCTPRRHKQGMLSSNSNSCSTFASVHACPSHKVRIKRKTSKSDIKTWMMRLCKDPNPGLSDAMQPLGKEECGKWKTTSQSKMLHVAFGSQIERSCVQGVKGAKINRKKRKNARSKNGSPCIKGT